MDEQHPPTRAPLQDIDIEPIARVCHEANRAYCLTLGDTSQLPWDEAPDWQRQSAINGVRLHLQNPGLHPSASHEAWMKEKIEQGWTYGAVKDAEAKTHPCLLSWHELPDDQRRKDVLFADIVGSLNAMLASADIAQARDSNSAKERCFQARDAIEVVKRQVNDMRSNLTMPNGALPGEFMANTTLAYRHLEDARMRMGKAVQALDGGNDCYPR